MSSKLKTITQIADYVSKNGLSNPVESARQLQRALDEKIEGVTNQADLSKESKLDRRWINNTLCILALPNTLLAKAEKAKLSRDTLILIARLEDLEQQKELIQMAEAGMSIRSIRAKMDEFKGVERTQPREIKRTSKDLAYLENVKTDADIKDLVDHLEADIKDRDTLIANLRSQISDQTVICKTIQEHCKAMRTRPTVKYSGPPKEKSGSPVSAVFQWGDWHIGEVIDKAETGHLNYNYAIARARMDLFIERVRKWMPQQYDVSELVITGMGDWINGDIHDEYKDTNEFSMVEQPIKAGQLLAESIANLREAIPGIPIRFVGVPTDNHGRMQRKPRAKKKWAHNQTLVVYEIAKAALSKMDNLTWEDSKNPIVHTRIQDIGFLVTHGDGIKGWAGIPFYGIQRAVTQQYQQLAQLWGSDPKFHFQYFLLAHFHVGMFAHNSIMINPSLCGTSEFDNICSRFAIPAQNAFLVGRRGAFNWTSIDLSDANP